MANQLANPLRSQKATRWTILTITWIAFLLRTVNLTTQSLWRDEVDAILLSSWKLKDLVAGLFISGHNGPLYFILLRFYQDLTGRSEFALRYPSSLLGTLAVPLGYVLARQLGFKRRAGLLLTLLLATSPYLVWYGLEAKMYTLLLVLIMVAFIAYLKALTGAGSKWWAVFVIATTLSFYTHILAPLMLAVYGVVALLHRSDLRHRWRGWLISMACLTVPYLPLALWQLPLLLEGYQSGHPFYPLQKEIYLLLQLYSSGLVRSINLTPIIIFVFLYLCGLFLGVGFNSNQRPTARSRYVLASWTLLPPLIVYLISWRVPVFEDRYLIYLTPAFYLVITIGLLAVRQHLRWLATLCLGLILIINLLGIWQQNRPFKADIRAAARHLLNQPERPSTIMVQMPYLQHTLNYYYPDGYTLLEGLWTNDNKSEATVHKEMSILTADLTDLWLIVSEENMWDNRHLTRAWLNEHANLVDEAHFMRVDLYYYQFSVGTVEQRSAGLAAE